MTINEKVYKKDFNEEDLENNFSIKMSEMQNYCIANNLCLEDGEDEDGYYVVIHEHPAIPLEEMQNAKLEELKRERDKNEQNPVLTSKGLFDVDDKSLSRINGAITVLSLTNSTIEWTLADNTVVEVTADDLQNVIVTLAMQSNEVHEKYRTLKEQVMACETAEEVKEIVW